MTYAEYQKRRKRRFWESVGLWGAILASALVFAYAIFTLGEEYALDSSRVQGRLDVCQQLFHQCDAQRRQCERKRLKKGPRGQ